MENINNINVNSNNNVNNIDTNRFPVSHCSAAFKVSRSNKWIKAMTIAKVQYYAFFKSMEKALKSATKSDKWEIVAECALSEQEYKKFLVLAERQYWNVKALSLDDSGNIVRKVRIWIEQAEII